MWLVDEEPWAPEFPRYPPHRGVKLTWCRDRDRWLLCERDQNNFLPALDWEKELPTNLSSNVLPGAPEAEETSIPVEISDLQLMDKQKQMLKGPDARMHELEIPSIVRAAVQNARSAKRRHTKNAFAKRQEAARCDKRIAAWQKRLTAMGVAAITPANVPRVNPKRRQAGHQLSKGKRRNLAQSLASTAKRHKPTREDQANAGDNQECGGPTTSSDPLVVGSEWQDQHVRIIQDQSMYDQNIGREGTVQEVRVSATGVHRALILTDGDASGRGVSFVIAALSCLVN